MRSELTTCLQTTTYRVYVVGYLNFSSELWTRDNLRYGNQENPTGRVRTRACREEEVEVSILAIQRNMTRQGMLTGIRSGRCVCEDKGQACGTVVEKSW